LGILAAEESLSSAVAVPWISWRCVGDPWPDPAVAERRRLRCRHGTASCGAGAGGRAVAGGRAITAGGTDGADATGGTGGADATGGTACEPEVAT